MSGTSVVNASHRVIRFPLSQKLSLKPQKLTQPRKTITMSKQSTETKEYVVTPAAPRDKTKTAIYTKKRKGIPVPAGMTFQDLSTEQRQEVLLGQENAWRKEYNKKRSTISMTGTLTRG